MAAFDCKSAIGVLFDDSAQVRVSGSNFTMQGGTWGSELVWAAAIYQTWTWSSTNASFTMFDRCLGGYATFFEASGNASTFSNGIFLSCGPAIGHSYEARGRDVIERCFFANTTLRGSRFQDGSVLIRDCLFEGEVPAMPVSFTADGVQQGNATTQIVFDTGSLLETCGGPPFRHPAATLELRLHGRIPPCAILPRPVWRE